MLEARATPVTSPTATSSAPLEGVRVVDFTSYASGPFCGLMLGLLGAEVIRIESRRRLDLNRRPHPLYGRLEIPNFDHLSGHKKSVTLDLKTEQGNALARELIGVSDAVIENFRPGVMERLGLDWPVVHELNPQAVMVSISAYGQEGPDSRRPGYAPVFAAEGGMGYLQGFPDGPPLEVRNQMDHQVGLTAAVLALALLAERDETGVGAHGDVSASEVASMLVGESIIAALADPHAALRPGNSHEVWSPHNVYPTAGEDGWIAIAVRDDAEWAALAEVVGEPELAAPELASASARRARRDEIDDVLAAWTTGQDGRDLAARLQDAGVCAEVSMSARAIVEDEHLSSRGSLTTIRHHEHGERVTVETPWRYELGSWNYTAWSPEIGHDTEQVLCGLLGHAPDEVARWAAEGALT